MASSSSTLLFLLAAVLFAASAANGQALSGILIQGNFSCNVNGSGSGIPLAGTPFSVVCGPTVVAMGTLGPNGSIVSVVLRLLPTTIGNCSVMIQAPVLGCVGQTVTGAAGFVVGQLFPTVLTTTISLLNGVLTLAQVTIASFRFAGVN